MKLHARICKSKPIKILSLFTGVVFLFSGIGKSLAAHEFSRLLTQYEFEILRFFAPIIILSEVALGILLVFYVRLKQTSLVALGIVTGLSLIYLYGYLFVNITDCGCFGHFSFLNMPPLFTFIRNFILMGMLLYIFLHSGDLHKTIDKKELAIMWCILCAVAFTTGYTYVERHYDATQYTTKGQYVYKDVKNSIFGEFLSTSKDSSYLVFVFSYACSHCYNSIENLKQYERSGVVDKVVALSFAADTLAEKKFRSIFHPDFQIKNYHPKQLSRLTSQFPTSYYIQNDTVRLEIRGVLPCGYIFSQQLQKIQKKH
jgi:uncharacterized membrane protein YphA (DoxX/SURF4 family)